MSWRVLPGLGLAPRTLALRALRAQLMAGREPKVRDMLEAGPLVHHTHDVELAARLVAHDHGLKVEDLPTARQKWYRVVPVRPGSYGYDEGWAFQYVDATPHARGAFRAVTFFHPW